MTNICDVAIIGAGPYGLSLAAHLAAAGVEFRIFGKTLDSWRHRMPKDMFLKSDGFASNISAPDEAGTLKAYCAARRIDYADQAEPVSLDLFIDYAGWFQRRYAPQVEETHVTRLARNGTGYSLELETGETLTARNVVVAAGITWFSQMHPALKDLPGWAASHSFGHREVPQFEGRDVAVLGAGASAINIAALLADSGANVQVIARTGAVRFHAPPDSRDVSFIGQLRNPPTGLGPGWRNFFCANTPLLFHRMPENFRLRVTRSHLGPAPGWFMRERVDGKIPMQLGTHVLQAAAKRDHVELTLADSAGNSSTASFDHVISGTGFRPDLTRLPFLSPSLLSGIAMVENTPVLSDQFETSAPGLYMTGPVAANAFGPLMRFMVGAEFAAPRIAAHLRRRLGAAVTARAA